MHEATDDWALGPYCGEIFTPRLLLSSESFLNIYIREYVSLKKTLALVMSFLSLSPAAALERFARVLTRLRWLERRRMPA